MDSSGHLKRVVKVIFESYKQPKSFYQLPYSFFRAKSVPKETIPQTKENVLTNIWLHKRSKEKELVRNEVCYFHRLSSSFCNYFFHIKISFIKTERTHGQALTTSNEDTDCGTKKSHGTQTQVRRIFLCCFSILEMLNLLLIFRLLSAKGLLRALWPSLSWNLHWPLVKPNAST